MSSAGDFVIENGVLKKYIGPGGDVVIPEGVTRIGYRAFRGSSLTSITIPESVTSIGNGAFDRCSRLTGITIPEGVTSIGDETFQYCSSLTGIMIPEGVTSIGNHAFAYCSSLTGITIPESVTSIGNHAFAYCSSLTGITIPEGVTDIGIETFQYCSSLTGITIPEGVTRIGYGAFYGCRSLTGITIPESVMSFGDHAFAYCSSLTGITIPEGVTRIGYGAFYGCRSLTGITIPESVMSFGDHAFAYCSSLTGITIPEGVTYIGIYVFENCSSLTSITIPESVTGIGYYELKDCSKLQWVISPVTLTCRSACGCSFALYISGEQSRWYAFSAKTECDNLSDFAKAGRWADYDRELINNGPKYKYKLPARLLGALSRLLYPVELTEENRALFEELLTKNAKKLVAIAEETGHPEMLRDLLSLTILDAKTLKALQKLMAASQDPEIAALAELKAEAEALPEKKQPAAPAVAGPLQAEYAAKLKSIKGDAVIRGMKLIGITMPKVCLADGTEAPEELFRFLLASYGVQKATCTTNYHFVPEADDAAKLLSYDSLSKALDTVSGQLDGLTYPAVLPLLCRYGSAQQIRALTKAYKEWGDWSRFGQKGRHARDVLMCALILSDTREAIVWMEQNWNLFAYAALRGVTEEHIYEEYLFDFGFGADGKRVFDLGVTAIEVSLTRELGLTLFDTVKKKTVRAIPKKGIDPAVQKKTDDEFADMRQSLKKAVKVKNDLLFKDYLAATEFPAENWKQSYLENPFLHRVAELLVWSQGQKCFLLTEGGAIDSAEQPYTITDEPIKIAHSMEMEADEVTAWQKHLTHHGLKQPFQQMWEPVIDPLTVRADRYAGCLVNPVYLKNQRRRGINTEWYESAYYKDKHVDIDGFRVTVNDDSDYIEILSLTPITWNRRTNMIITFLDRITVWDRVRKDDLTVTELLPGFTLAQITEFIAAAQEAKATNVLAALLEYKNTRFADFDPMAEFTLE